MTTPTSGGCRAAGGLLAVAAATALSLTVAGCGSSSGAAGPPIDASVADAARAADCTVRGYPRDEAEAARPAVVGSHNVRWADWGVYESVVPERYLAHNMAHRGVVVRLGAGVPPRARRAILDLWSVAPRFVVVVPGTAGVASAGAAVTSWKRALVCPVVTPATVAALRAYIDVYRGASGIHPADPTNYPGPAPRPADLPAPVRADPDA